MFIAENIAWFYYLPNQNANESLDDNKVGKWMYFFDNRNFIEQKCKEAIEKGIVIECKHSNAESGVSCFYLYDDDLEGHRRVIQFFMDNNMIKRTKTGRLYNISFKHDKQTLTGEYGKDYHSDIKLKRFVDLNTGEWKI